MASPRLTRPSPEAKLGLRPERQWLRLWRSAGLPVNVMKTSSRVGPQDRDVVDADAGVVEAADGLGDHAAVLADREAHGPLRARGWLVGERRDRRQRGLTLRGVVEHDLDPLAADRVLELVGGALGDHRAVVDDRDPVGEPVRLVEVLGRQQDGRPRGDAILDHLPERDPAARVEAGRRLVEEDHRRAGDERPREVEPAPHAAGVGLDEPARGVGEAEALEQLGRPLARLGAGEVVELAEEHEVLLAGEVLVDRRVLPREADLRAQLGRVGDDVEAGDASRAVVGRQQRRQDPDRRRLPGPVRAEQPEHGPGLDPEVDPGQRDDVAERLPQALDLDRAHAGASYPAPGGRQSAVSRTCGPPGGIARSARSRGPQAAAAGERAAQAAALRGAGPSAARRREKRSSRSPLA